MNLRVLISSTGKVYYRQVRDLVIHMGVISAGVAQPLNHLSNSLRPLQIEYITISLCL